MGGGGVYHESRGGEWVFLFKSDSKHTRLSIFAPGKKTCTQYATHLTACFQNGHLSIFGGQIFLQTEGLKKKREAVRSPKSGEVSNPRWENHMYGQ